MFAELPVVQRKSPPTPIIADAGTDRSISTHWPELADERLVSLNLRSKQSPLLPKPSMFALSFSDTRIDSTSNRIVRSDNM